MTFTLQLTDIAPVTHDTKRLRFTRPDGFDFEPGQATHMALDRDGWREEDRPFTMTSQPEEEGLEFVIKIYPEHEGVTREIAKMVPGDRVLAEAPAGEITDHGPGTFIAGGAGITPYICILRRRAMRGALDGCHLIFSNKTEADIILREEWDKMAGLKTTYVLTDEDAPGLPKGKIDAAFLDRHLTTRTGPFYLCGPHGMVDDLREALKQVGVAEGDIVTEAGW